jgi:hypothetical protein
MTIPVFSLHENNIVYENPKCISDGLLLCKEATIEINTKHIRNDFLQRLMYHMGEGHIQVKVAKLKEQKMIHTDEDDEFERIERENTMKGQPYHFDIFVSPSQRNQVLEEAAKMIDEHPTWTGRMCAQEIRNMKK